MNNFDAQKFNFANAANDAATAVFNSLNIYSDEEIEFLFDWKKHLFTIAVFVRGNGSVLGRHLFDQGLDNGWHSFRGAFDDQPLHISAAFETFVLVLRMLDQSNARMAAPAVPARGTMRAALRLRILSSQLL